MSSGRGTSLERRNPLTDALAARPEEVIYRICYARTDLVEFLQSAEKRSGIRRLPAAQLFYGLKELEGAEIRRLLPHITEEQWTGILDLDLWSKDGFRLPRFLYWESYILQAEDAVARKLLRGTDDELLELVLNPLRVHRLDEDGAPETELAAGQLETPDHHFVVELPEDPEEARFLRNFILRLYDLDAEGAALLLEDSQFRTWSEMEETAYQSRKHRVEEMGFQDYFDAIEIYSILSPEEPLPEKQWDRIREVDQLPVAAAELESGLMFLIAVLARFTQPQDLESLLEELFFTCNKLLCADHISPDDPTQVKEGIYKVVCGINLGLERWAKGDLLIAEEGLAKHYLQSFFRLGYGEIKTLQEEARGIQSKIAPPELGSFPEALLEGILASYPQFTELVEGKISGRFFTTSQDLEIAREQLTRMEESDPK